MKVKKVENDTDISVAKVNKAYEALVNVFKKYKLSVPELLVVYGNLGYTIGASIEGYVDKGPSTQELEKMYYTKPTVGVSLMLQGLQTTLWTEDLNKTVEELKKERGKKS